MAKAILARQGIYVIRCLATGAVYVGSSLRIDLRWNLHRSRLRANSHHSALLQKAWNDHGEIAFAMETLELVGDPERLFEREQSWINALGAGGPHGLNASPSAGSLRGYKMATETRARMSSAQLGLKRSAETRANIATAARNRSAETRENMAAAQRGKSPSPETRAKLSAAHKGKPKSEAHKRAIGEALRARRAG